MLYYSEGTQAVRREVSGSVTCTTEMHDVVVLHLNEQFIRKHLHPCCSFFIQICSCTISENELDCLTRSEPSHTYSMGVVLHSRDSPIHIQMC